MKIRRLVLGLVGALALLGAVPVSAEATSSPIASLVATPATATVGQTVTFDLSLTSDPDGDLDHCVVDPWDSTPTVTVNAVSGKCPNVTHVYTAAGTYPPVVDAFDALGNHAVNFGSVTITAPPVTEFGMSMNQTVGGAGQSWNQARAVYDSNYGDATHKPIQRSFISGMPSASNWGNVAPTDRDAVISFKTNDFAGVSAGNYDTGLTAFFTNAPTNHKYWYTFYHEMEDNVTTTAAKAAYISAAQHVVTLQRSVANSGNLIPTIIYSDFTLAASSGRDWHDWYWGNSFVTVVAWDQYNYQNANCTLNTEATKQANRASVAASASVGKAYAVAEFPIGGSKFEDCVTGGDTTRANWLSAIAQSYEDNGAAFVTAFDTNVGGTFSIEGTHPTIVAAYKAVVTA